VSYRELPPPPDLAHVVRCIWQREGTGNDTLVLPDGCVDVVARGGRALVAGPDTGPQQVTVAVGERIAGVRFHPGAGGAALGVPADELRDGRLTLEEVWGAPGRAIGERAEADAFALVAALRTRLAAAAPDPRVLAAARRLDHAPGTRIPALADATGIGERQLRRRFAAAVGYGPKTFARIARFRRALALIRAGEPAAAAAYAAGYADQAHMTREMRAFAGLTPAALRAA
jgi:AraC-like DNA-binding protein